MIDPARRLARNLDPHTSHQAAQDITTSGEHDRQLSIVLDAVRRHPGCTSAELGQTGTGLDRYQIARRLSELKGLVMKGPARVCRVTGHRALTWNPVGSESDQLRDGLDLSQRSSSAVRHHEQHETDAAQDAPRATDGTRTPAPPGWLFSPAGGGERR